MNSNIIQCNPDELYFDEQNPRLVENPTNTSNQDKILNVLWREQDIKVLVMSILANGFFPNEALYAVEEGGRKIVIEGNRRLAAVKSILNPSLVDNNGMEKYRESITAEITESLRKGIPVIMMYKREDAWRYIGFKHVNGPSKWDSYAKAVYIAKVHNQYHVSLDEISQQIGDPSKLTKKLYQGLMVLREADKCTEFKIDDIFNNRIYFSHIYTAITYDGFRNFLGLTDESLDTDMPVPQEKLKNLEDVMLWMYGSKKRGQKTLIKSQNPYLSRLNQILTNPEAIETLRVTQDIDSAYEASEPSASVLYQSIVEANLSVEKALAKISGYDGSDDIMRSVIKLAKNSESLYEGMKDIRNRMKENSNSKWSLD